MIHQLLTLWRGGEKIIWKNEEKGEGLINGGKGRVTEIGNIVLCGFVEVEDLCKA